MNLETVSTDRVEEIKEHIKEIGYELLDQSIKEIEQYFETHMEEAVDVLYEHMNGLYQDGQNAQAQNKIGKISYIRIFQSKAAVLEGSYKLIIRLYDEEDYNNPNEISVEWNPAPLVELFQKQTAIVLNKVSAKIFRITSREMQLTKFLFAEYFKAIAVVFILILKDVFVYVENIFELETEDEILITFGNYMEQGNLVNIFSKPVEEKV